MSEQQDPLANLWQSQPVQTIEPEELKAIWQKNRRRQWWWLMSDLSGVLICVFFCFYVFLYQDNLFKQIWVSVFVVIVLVFTPLSVRLRYKSLESNVNTSEYLECIVQQRVNNIRLIDITMWLWIVIWVCYGIWTMAYFLYYEPHPVDFFWNTLRVSLVFFATALATALWSKYYVKKNKSELDKFLNLSQ